jgi:hypothetical protein
MTVTLELRPEVEARLTEHARAKGLSIDAYVERVLTDVVQRPTVAEFNEALDRLAEMGKGLPDLPDSALTRESFYEGRD